MILILIHCPILKKHHLCFQLVYYQLVIYGDASKKSITRHHDTKTSCFGGVETALYDDRKAIYGIKTTCFVVVEAIAIIL